MDWRGAWSLERGKNNIIIILIILIIIMSAQEF